MKLFSECGSLFNEITDAKALRATWYCQDHVKHWNVTAIGNKIVETLTFSTPSIYFNIIYFASIRLTYSTPPPQTMLYRDSINFLATYGQH